MNNEIRINFVKKKKIISGCLIKEKIRTRSSFAHISRIQFKLPATQHISFLPFYLKIKKRNVKDTGVCLIIRH